MANINETISEVAKLNPELARQIQKYVKDHSYGLVFEHNLPEAVRLYKKQPAVGDTVNILAPRGQKETEENSVPWCVKYIDNGIAYPKHIISDDEGWAYLKLNDLEEKVVQTELSRTLNVAWYRNQPRNLNAF